MSLTARKSASAPWAPEAIVSLARRHMGRVDSVFYAPAIPHGKLRNARAVHALHLPEEEPILVLYDGTLLGSAKDGFVVTPERLCWKNLWDHPRQIPWSDLDPEAISRRSGKIEIACGAMMTNAGLVPSAAAFFIEMASRLELVETSPYRTADLPPTLRGDAVISTERLISLARAHVGEVDGLYFHPSIPSVKRASARGTHVSHLLVDEVVAVLFDDTLFGGAEEGFLLTDQRLCWKNLLSDPQHLLWSGIAKETIISHGSSVGLMGGALQLTARDELVPKVSSLLYTIVTEVERMRREPR